MDDKKLSQLPLTTSIDEDALLYAVNSGQSVAIKKNDLMASGIEPNEVIQIGLIEIIDDSGDKYLKIAETPNPKWRINGTVYTRTTESLTLIPFAATGKYRVDIFVGDAFSDVQRIEGVEDDDVGVPPAIPDNTVEITRVNIFGNDISDPSSPPTGGYIKQLSKQYRSKNLTDPLYNVLYIDAYNTTFWVHAEISDSINGFTEGTFQAPVNPLYDGMDVFINAKTAVTLIHQDPNAPIKFYFADGNDLVVSEKSTVHLKWNKTNSRMELVGVSSSNKNILTYESIIGEMLTSQAQQSTQNIIFVEKAHEDPSLNFPAGETRTYAYYQLRSDATKTGSLSDYRLVSAPWANVGGGIDFTTDESLYLDPITNELRANVSDFSEKYTYAGGVQEFVLISTPVKIIYISVNGQLLEDPLTQWSIDVPTKTITILDELYTGDRVTIHYQYFITT